MNKALSGAMVLLGLAVAAGSGYWFGTQRHDSGPLDDKNAPRGAAGQVASPATAPETILVKLARVAMVALPQTITAVGSLRSDESVTLRPEVAGRITQILFQEGQRVSKGEPLVRLDQSINLAEVRQARANLTLARAKYERSVDLAGRNFISGQAKDEAKNNLEIAASGLALAEARLRKMELKAPFSGIIGLRLISEGDYVSAGADLVTLQAIDPLKVDFRVPETFLRQVRVGQTVEVALDALPGKTYEGKISALDPLVDAAGRAIVIRAQVANQDTAMRPGMFARVTLITQAEKDALMLPEEALVPRGTEQFVFRVVNAKAVSTKVTTGQRREGKVEILSGLSKDDVVVTAGQLKLREGTPVRAAGGESNGTPAKSNGTPARSNGNPARMEPVGVPNPASAVVLSAR